jgi:hypothetical protein
MAWTYDTELAAEKDKIRLLIGDTVQSRPLIQDEEINYLLTTHDFYEAAAQACEVIARKLNEPEFHRGSWSEKRTDMINLYLDAAMAFRARVGGPVIIDPVKGTTDEKRTAHIDVGMHDYPVSE